VDEAAVVAACCAESLNSELKSNTRAAASRLPLRAKLNLPNSITDLWWKKDR
jgi:hypothetical protein